MDPHPPHRRQIRDRARHAAGLLPARRRPLRGRRLQWRIANSPRLVPQPQGPPQITVEVGTQTFTVLAQELDGTARAELMAEAARGVSCRRRTPGQDHPADPGARADPPRLTRDRFAHTVSPRRSSQRSHAMSDRFLGAPMLVVGQMQGGHGQQARAGWVFDVVHVLMSAGRVAADGLVRLRRHLTRAGLHQRNGAVLASPPAWRPSCADAGHHDLDDHRHARG
jgi:hypothetical protein